jgi:hypothetical protein
MSRADLALARRAARERWGVPDTLKTEALLVAQEMLRSIDDRKQSAALRFLATCDRVDQLDDKLQLERDKIAPPTETQGRDAWDIVCDDVLGTSEAGPGAAPERPGGV